MASGGRSLVAEQDKPTLSTADYLTKEELPPDEKVYFEECKQYYYLTEKPLISISEEIFNDTSDLTHSLLKFGIDEECDQVNLQDFITKVCEILNIQPSDIIVKKIQSGSTIVETEINDKFEKHDIKLKLKVIYNMLVDKTTDEVQKFLGKLKVFFMYMGPVVSFSKKQKYREELRLNPQFNRIYCLNQTYWSGSLNDGKDRGNQPYYCPIGWKRYSFYVTDDFDKKFNGWCICYHGTKFAFGLSILLSGLKPAQRAEHGSGIYATPSVNYAAHPRYSEVKLIDRKHQKQFFKNGKYVQFVLECRVHPNNIKSIKKETLDGQNTLIDSNVTNDKIEWVIDNKNQSLVDFNDPDSSIICTGLMIRLTDNHPGLLPESQWWHEAHLCEYNGCCCLGIDRNELRKLKNMEVKCNIIYE